MEGDRTAFADECRRAGLAFMRGVALGWEFGDLEAWQRDQYGKLAIQPRDIYVMTPQRISAAAAIPPLSDLLREARWKAFASLEEASGGHARFVQQIAGERLIVRDVEHGWVPVDRKGASLRGRVLSLFAVDCLLRPTDYRTVLFACPRCESIVFSAKAREEGQCCGELLIGSGERPTPRGRDSRRSVPAPSEPRRKA